MVAVLAIAVTAFELTAPAKQTPANNQEEGQTACDKKFQDEAKQNLMLRKFISYTNTSRFLVR